MSVDRVCATIRYEPKTAVASEDQPGGRWTSLAGFDWKVAGGVGSGSSRLDCWLGTGRVWRGQAGSVPHCPLRLCDSTRSLLSVLSTASTDEQRYSFVSHRAGSSRKGDRTV